MEFLIIILIFIFGTIFGSLGSVLLTRLADKHDRQTIKRILFGFSACPQCHHRLHAHNLIPLRSYLMQRGKCAYCKSKIPTLYPILEISTGLIFVMSYILVFHTLSYLVPDAYKLPTLFFRTITNRSLLLLIIHDIQHKELHMPMWTIGILRVLIRQFTGKIGNYQQAVLGSLLLGGIFTGIYFFAKRYVRQRFKENGEGFGEGDIYLGGLLGSLSPFIAMYNALPLNLFTTLKIIISLILISCVLGILYFLLQELRARKSKHKDHNTHKIIPFFPALIIAFWILLFYGDHIIRRYFNR